MIDVLASGDLTLSRVTATGAIEIYPGSLVAGTGVRRYGALRTSKVKVIGNGTIGNSANNGGGILIGRNTCPEEAQRGDRPGKEEVLTTAGTSVASNGTGTATAAPTSAGSRPGGR